MEEKRSGEPSLTDIGEHVKNDLWQLRDAAERRREEALDQVQQFVNEHPIASVGAAFGAGYLLSGALFSRMTARLVTLGARFYFSRVFSDVMAPLSVPSEPPLPSRTPGGKA